MKMGPKTAVDTSPLPFSYKGKQSYRLAAFSKQFLTVPKGEDVGKPLVLRKWQRELLATIFDAEPRPRTAGWTLPRGQGKSTFAVVPALYELFCGEIGGQVVFVAENERQAKNILFGTARLMVESSPELAARAKIYEERIEVPGRNSVLLVLSSTPGALQGLDPSFAVIDEYGFTDPRAFDAVALAAGKRRQSTCLGIGTPGPSPDSKLFQLREYSFTHPNDPTTVYVEYSAAGFENIHAPDCVHCWELANPAMYCERPFLFPDAMTALLPPKMDESEFRRVRLCQPVRGGGQQYLDGSVWADCAEPDRTIPDGARVVLGLDGSRSNDATALVVTTVEARPIVAPIRIWTPDAKSETSRVPILEVEDAIRQACQRYDVIEIACDFYLWERTAQILEDEGYPVVKFPQGHDRMVPATAALREAVHQREITHTEDATLTAHVLNAVVKEVPRGVVVRKVTPNSALKIDGLIATILAFNRAKWHHLNAPKSSKLRVMKIRK